MNCLAEAASRLCTEIVALRSDRESLRRALQEQTIDRRVSVRKRCLELKRDRMATGEMMGEQRRSFTNNLRQVVAGQQQAVRDDLVAARKIWMGKAECCR